MIACLKGGRERNVTDTDALTRFSFDTKTLRETPQPNMFDGLEE